MDYLLSDGSFLSLPDDLTEEEIQERIQSFETKFIPPTVEEETVATTPVVTETTEEPSLTIENPYASIAPKLRPEEARSEGDSIGQQFVAGFEQEALTNIDKEKVYESLLEEEQSN
jgi:hypothetical protein